MLINPNAHRIYFLLLAKFPKLLYVNYFENGKLLANWLGISKDPSLRPQDAYTIQQTAIQLGMSEDFVAGELADAMVEVDARRNPS